MAAVTSPARQRYHHGDLRAALLDAAEALAVERGAHAFTVTDAARRAGVSSAAPYRHFRDRADLLGHLAARGFEELGDAVRAARDQHPPGSVEAMVALGTAYLDFVVGRPGLFHVMWNVTSDELPHPEADDCGRTAYGVFTETVAALRRARGLEHMDEYALGTPLWAMVHGLASLLLARSEMVDRDPEKLHALVDNATRAYVAGLSR